MTPWLAVTTPNPTVLGALRLRWRPQLLNFTRYLLGYAGYSYFHTGEFIHKTGRDKNSNFVYAALQYTF